MRTCQQNIFTEHLHINHITILIRIVNLLIQRITPRKIQFLRRFPYINFGLLYLLVQSAIRILQDHAVGVAAKEGLVVGFEFGEGGGLDADLEGVGDFEGGEVGQREGGVRGRGGKLQKVHWGEYGERDWYVGGWVMLVG